MFGLVKPHPGEIPLDVAFPNLPKDAWELARFWMTSERSFVTVGRNEKWHPELLGMLLVECVHLAAGGYAAAENMPQSEALERIWRGFDEERARLASGSEELH